MDRSDPPVTIEMDTCPPCTGACMQGRCTAPRRADPMVVSVLLALAAFWALVLGAAAWWASA